MLNSVCLVGKITDAGMKLYCREHGTPECRWTMLLEESGQDEATFKLFCPVVAYGAKAEAFAATLGAGDVISLSGKLGRHKPAATKKDPAPVGRLVVSAWQGSVVTPAMVESAN